MLFKTVKTKYPETIAPVFFGGGREMFLTEIKPENLIPVMSLRKIV